MRAPLPAGGKIELGTGYAGALAPKASPRRQLPRASRGGGGGWGGASRQQQPTSTPRTSHHLATASAAKSKKLDKAPGKREEKYRSWRSVAERGARPPDPRPAGGPGRGLAPQRAKLFASSRNNWRFTTERGALPPDPRPAGGPGRGLAHSEHEEREATPVPPRCLRPRTRPAAAPRVGTGLAKDNRPPSAPRAGQSQLASKADAS